MLRRSFTAVIERNATFGSDFATEPYEVGWASEARWFVRVLRADEGTALVLTPQISPDGLSWCDGGGEPVRMNGTGLVSLPLTDFGSWLRLNAELTGTAGSVTVLIYLSLKE